MLVFAVAAMLQKLRSIAANQTWCPMVNHLNVKEQVELLGSREKKIGQRLHFWFGMQSTPYSLDKRSRFFFKAGSCTFSLEEELAE